MRFLYFCPPLLHLLFCVSVSVTRPSTDPSLQLPSELDLSQVRDVVPLEASDFYDRLTNRDKEVLQNVLSKANTYNSAGEVLKDLRNGSSTLYDKAAQMVLSIRGTMAKLSPPARSFVDQCVDQLRGAVSEGFSLANIKAQAQQLVGRYRKLNGETRQELREAFPVVATVLDNSVLQTLASGLLGIEADQPEAGGDERPEGRGEGGGDGRDEGEGGGEGEVEDGVGERAEKRMMMKQMGGGGN